MSRTKLALPESFPFQTIIPIRITDINYGGHVGNDGILTLLHEARMQFLQSHSLSEMSFGGASLIMRDVNIEFKKEVFYGDVIKVFVTIADFTNVGFDVYYKVQKNEDGVLVAIARTGMACYNYQQKKVTKVPEVVLAAFSLV